MSTVSKVIIKEGSNKVTFQQTDEAVLVRLPIKNVLLKQIDIFYSDLVLKVSAQSIKYFQAVDFLHEIEHRSPKNRVQLLDTCLEVYLVKKQQGVKWDSLEPAAGTFSRKELFDRRQASIARYDEEEKQRADLAFKTKNRMEKEVVDEQIKVDAFQRNTIQKTKDAELKNAQDAIFSDINEVKQKDAKLSELSKQHASGVRSEDELRAKTKQVLRDIEAGIDKDAERKAKHNRSSNAEAIFGDDDLYQPEKKAPAPTTKTAYKAGEQVGQCTVEEIEDEEEAVTAQQVEEDAEEQEDDDDEPVIEEAAAEPPMQLPEVRGKSETKKMEFTEKKFPNMPARESHYREAPYPKSKKIEKPKENPYDQYIGIEDKDPVWLKDKADHFYKQHDFNAAVAAYSKALEQDKEFLAARLNRSTTFMRMRNFVAAIQECDDIDSQIENMDKNERRADEEFYDKLLGRMYLKRGAANAWMSQFDAAIADFKKAMTYKGIYDENQIKKMEQDVKTIEKRKESQNMKLNGDIAFARNCLDEALEAYEKALELDPSNEYALSNIGVIYLKRQNYEKCMEYTERALAYVEGFQADTKEFQKENTLEVKLLQRRAKCNEVAEKFELARKDLDRALFLEPQNAAVKAAQAKVQNKLNTIRFEEYREQANNYLKKKMFAEALQYYDKCLKITRQATTLDNVAVFVNKAACLLSLEKFSQVVVECNDAIRLIKNYKNRNDGKHTDEDVKRMQQMDLRIAVRKATALSKLGKVQEAIAEYERADKIDPKNAQVKKELDVLRRM